MGCLPPIRLVVEDGGLSQRAETSDRSSLDMPADQPVRNPHPNRMTYLHLLETTQMLCFDALTSGAVQPLLGVGWKESPE